MRFTGSKHMDHLLAEFYDAVFKQNRHQEVSIFSLSKSYIKLLDNIEKQRTVLSANLDHQLNVESLIDDHDLVYHMKREEL
jgi:molecular chaperone DnaK (HSP70)